MEKDADDCVIGGLQNYAKSRSGISEKTGTDTSIHWSTIMAPRSANGVLGRQSNGAASLAVSPPA